MSQRDGPIVRWREAFAGLSERAAPGPGCPDPDRLWAVAAGEVPVAERHEVIAHTATCASCAHAFRLARGLSQEERERTAGDAPVVEPRVLSRPWFRRRAPLAALAAALALAVLIPVWRLSQPAPGYRDGERLEVRSLLAEGVVLSRREAMLRWSAGPPGSRYEVRVLTREAREVVVETGLESPAYRIPPSALAGVPGDTVLYWQVKTLRPDGTSGVSKTFSIRLR